MIAMTLQTIPYSSYEKGLPQEDNFILGQKKNDNIIVYQAFNHAIANYAITNQRFGGDSYSFSRMSWIKPNFLWMMYRSGWAEKENQNRILAIEISFSGFEDLLEKGVLTTYDTSLGTKEDWRAMLDTSDVRIQWDPDHDANGRKLQRRAVQIGIKNSALLRFNNEYIQSIADITDFVRQQKELIDKDEEVFFVVNEQIIEVSYSLKVKYSIPQNFVGSFISRILAEFNIYRKIESADFENLLLQNGENRNEIVMYIKNHKNTDFSRYLLKTAISYRKGDIGTCGCMCEDLLMFSYFASKNETAADFDLIMEAKLADFDTWCGFDGEMIFYTFGYEGTKDYLKKNVEKFSLDTVEYFLEFDEEYLYNDINSRAFWYL